MGAHAAMLARSKLLVVACVCLAVAPWVHASPVVDSNWEFHSDPTTQDCSAELLTADGYSIALATVGGQAWLWIAPAEKLLRRGYQSGSIRADTKPFVEFAFVDEQGSMRTILTPQLASYIQQASRIRIEIGERALDFNSRGIETAIDKIQACSLAHSGSVAANVIKRPAVSAKNWSWIEGTSGGCALRAAGRELDTILMLNDRQQLILTAGRSDWTLPTGTGEIRLRIDQGAPATVEANTFQNLVLVRVSDPMLLEALKKGTTLTWELPSGPMSSDISGMANALQALSGCRVGN